MMSARDRLLKLIFEDDSDDDLLFEESDEEIIEEDFKRLRWIRDNKDLFDTYDDQEFIMNFRLSKESVLFLLEKIGEKLMFLSNRNCPIPPVNQLLGTLRFYATGCPQQEAGNSLGYSKSSSCRVIHRVSDAIASLAPIYIKFPETESKISEIKQDFYKIARFPNVIGVMDCTYIRIKSPGGADAIKYENKKGFPSLNVQCICNANYEFIDIVANCPGGMKSYNILNFSSKKILFDEGRFQDAFVLADKSYPCSKYVLPPLKKAETSAELLFNKSQVETWSLAKKAIENWKRRFPILALGMRISLDHVCDVITATAVLHNIAQHNGEELPPDDPALKISWEILLQEGDLNEENVPEDAQINDIRHRLIHDYFENLTES